MPVFFLYVLAVVVGATAMHLMLTAARHYLGRSRGEAVITAVWVLGALAVVGYVAFA